MRANSARGFTLLEIIIGIVAFGVTGVLLALIYSVFGPQVVRGTDPLFSMRAAELGQSYLEETLGKRFDENSPFGNMQRCGEGTIACAGIGIDAGETANVQSTFDDVDDYNTLVNAQPRDQSGAVRSGYENFRVSVVVIAVVGEFGLNANSAKRIEVTITDPNNSKYVFSAYKANF